MSGLGLALAGSAMKLPLVKPHWWTPDSYQGAGSVVSRFLTSAAESAVIVVLSRAGIKHHGLTLTGFSA